MELVGQYLHIHRTCRVGEVDLTREEYVTAQEAMYEFGQRLRDTVLQAWENIKQAMGVMIEYPVTLVEKVRAKKKRMNLPASIVGERGEEAIIPLSQAQQRFIQHNGFRGKVNEPL